MRPVPLALGAATLLAFAAIVGLAAYGEGIQYLPIMFLYASWIIKLAVFLLLAVLGLAALGPNRPGEASARLNNMAVFAVGLGLVVTLLALNNRGLYCGTETDHLKVWGSDYAQSLMPLAFGLLAATVATARAGKRPAA